MKPNLETGWLEWLQIGPDRGSEAKLERIFQITSVTPQRRAWSLPASWLFELPRLGPTARVLAYVILVLLLVVALAVGVSGSRPPLPRPFGLASNGLLAVEAGGTIMLVNPDGSGSHVIESGEGRSLSPQYSPDGTHFVFWSQPADGTLPLSLYVASADGRGIRKINGDLAIETDSLIAPSWSPDSTQVVFATETDHNGILGDGSTTLYTVAVDGHSQPVPVTSAGGYHSPSWSPDGNWIAYAYPKPPTRNWLAIAHPDGSGERWLHRQPALNAENEPSFAEALSWTVDSGRIAFVRGSDVSNPAEQRESVYLVAIDLDGHEQVYSQSGGFLGSPSWSPDDQWLAFIGGENSRMTFVIKPDGSQLRQMGACTDSDGLTWSPDGRLLVVTCGTSSEMVPIDHPEAAYDAPVPPAGTVADWQRIAP